MNAYSHSELYNVSDIFTYSIHTQSKTGVTKMTKGEPEGWSTDVTKRPTQNHRWLAMGTCMVCYYCIRHCTDKCMEIDLSL